MQYTIEVDKALNDVLNKTALKKNIGVPELIVELLKRFSVDAHIMEQTELWQNGIKECAEINLDWANL